MSPAETPTPPEDGRTGPGRPSALRSTNLGVRILCELALLVALAVWGFSAGSGLATDLVLGLGAPLLAAVVWSLWVAPASRRRLPDPARLLVEVLVFAAGVAALAAAGYPLVAVGFAAVVASTSSSTASSPRRQPWPSCSGCCCSWWSSGSWTAG
jgi:hypothetical protein